jgi:multicomponent Na+:H+ antiporter subunit D
MNTQSVYTSFVPLYAILVSLIAVPLIILSSKKRNLREFWTIAASLIKFGLVVSLVPNALLNKAAELSIVEISPGIELALKADPFGVFFALVASGLWIFTSFYSIGLSSTIGVAFAANLLTFVVFYEILTIATYPLVIHKEDEKSIKAGRKYLVYTLTAGSLLIAATAVTYQITNNLDFKAGGIFENIVLSPNMAWILFLLFLGGVGVKASIMPLHSWLPTAMAAPTPVSALLHAVAVVKSGVFGVVRVVCFVFGPKLMFELGLNNILIIFAGFTIVVASLMALKQDNLKRRLAYSTISHLSYIVLGAGLISSAALLGAIMHIAFHAVMKITLFFCAGAIYVNLHKENISELNGVGKVMPWTMGAFAVGAIGLTGIPPVNGFVSKWYLGLGALQTNNLIALIILIISGLLNAAYFFPIIHRAFFRTDESLKGKKEASPFMVVPLVITAILAVLFGIYPDFLFDFYHLALRVVTNVFGGISL